MSKKKIGKTLDAAKARVQKTRADYLRAAKAYNARLYKELGIVEPVDLSKAPGATIKQLRKALKVKK